MTTSPRSDQLSSACHKREWVVLLGLRRVLQAKKLLAQTVFGELLYKIPNNTSSLQVMIGHRASGLVTSWHVTLWHYDLASGLATLWLAPRWVLFTSETLWGCAVSMSDFSSARTPTLCEMILKTQNEGFKIVGLLEWSPITRRDRDFCAIISETCITSQTYNMLLLEW